MVAAVLLGLSCVLVGAHAVGAPAKVDVLSDRHKAVVDFAVLQLEGGVGGACKKKVLTTKNFSQQLVSGFLYKFDLVLQHSEDNPPECARSDEVPETCSMVVHEVPWLHSIDVLWDNVDCVGRPDKDHPQPAELVRVPLTRAASQGRVTPLLGADLHDKVPHGRPLLGSGDHDKVAHGEHLLGSDKHGPMFSAQHTMKELRSAKQSQEELKKLQSLGAFHEFMSVQKKSYPTQAEYKYRYGVFRQNMKKVQFLTESELGTGEYGATAMADLTEMEFKQKFLGMKPKWKRLSDDPDIHWPAAEIPDVDLPREFDWREKGAVTEVKNQGTCGSCWAFSVTGNVEGGYFVKHGELLDLSEQELVDCDTRDSGCSGGLPENAYKTLFEIGGLETEEDYGYDGKDEACQFNRSKVAARVSGGLEISQNETQMAQWLVQNGPISVGLNANAMQFYKGGVSKPFPFLCSPDGIDHGVLIVGFGEHDYPVFQKKLPYWIIKNSWGPEWGEQGYYRLYRGDGRCGINMMTSSAVVE